jgi:hypothetical protein
MYLHEYGKTVKLRTARGWRRGVGGITYTESYSNDMRTLLESLSKLINPERPKESITIYMSYFDNGKELFSTNAGIIDGNIMLSGISIGLTQKLRPARVRNAILKKLRGQYAAHTEKHSGSSWVTNRLNFFKDFPDRLSETEDA